MIDIKTVMKLKKIIPEQSSEGTILARLDKKLDGRDSVVGIMFRYVLEGSGFENLSRCVQIFPASPKVPEAHLSSFKMGTWSLSQGY